MKQFFFIVTMLLTLVAINAQDASSYRKAIINDPDGYTNVREGESVNYNIITKIFENEVFYAYPSISSNWYPVITQNGTKGYVHNSRISFLNTNNSNQNITIDEISFILNILGANSNNPSKLICKRNTCKKEFCCGWEHSSSGGCREACITGIKCRGNYCSQSCCERE